MFCKKCGNNLPDNAKFCNKCGAPQVHPDISTTPPEKKEPEKLESGTSNTRKYIVIGIVGIIAVIIIAAVFFYVILGAGFFVTQKSQENSDITYGGASTPTSTVYDDYVASYSWDGKLEEKIFYRVTLVDKLTMLYRNFIDPLVTKSIPYPHIEFISINAPEGTIAYIKDNMGTVSFPNRMGDTNDISRIKSLSQKNEVGIYRAGGFEPGVYPVIYDFRFYPLIEYDQSAVHLNIQLLHQNAHPTYERVKILVPEKSVKEIYFSPSHLIVEKNNDSIIATGQLAENENLNFEVILEKDTLKTLSGFPNYTENIISRTETAYPNQNPFIPFA